MKYSIIELNNGNYLIKEEENKSPDKAKVNFHSADTINNSNIIPYRIYGIKHIKL